MTRIIFVDDEGYVLDGLRRMLHSRANTWDMLFITDPREALKTVEASFCNIVVSDLRMPEMDGSTLLRYVQRISPQTVRIALSGFADRKTTLHAISQVHQFLAKPCEPEELIHILERAANLGALLTNKRIARFLTGLNTIPSLNSLHREVIEQLETPETSAAHIGDIIARDAGMSSKILQLVNSAFFGLRHVVADPAHATVLLGLDMVHVLVLSIRIFDQFTQENLGAISVPRLWEHCVAVARLAKQIATIEQTSETLADHAFLAGLLHDVGKMVLSQYRPSGYEFASRLTERHNLTASQLEERIFGANHAEVCAYLMGLWGFTEPVINAIQLHHTPSHSPELEFSPLTAVHSANVLINTLMPDPSGLSNAELDMAYIERIGCVNHMPRWEELARKTLAKENAS